MSDDLVGLFCVVTIFFPFIILLMSELLDA